MSENIIKVGISGTGFIAQGILRTLSAHRRFKLAKILSKRKNVKLNNVDSNYITNSIEEFLSKSDVIIECSGHVVHSTNVISEALKLNKPVVTMNSEFHVTVGSYFCNNNLLTEAEGDQPGCLAALIRDTEIYGFKSLVFGNVKGYLNHTPSEEDMIYWSKKNGISLTQVTSFTDGTKMQIEQAFIANGFGGTIAQRGMLGPKNVSLQEGSNILADFAKTNNVIIGDYILNNTIPPGVFLVGEHPTEKPEVLRYLKLGKGPFYTLLRPYHLCHLELFKTLDQMCNGQKPLLTNSSRPSINIAAIAKKDLKKGDVITQAIGGFGLRGEAVQMQEYPDAVPIGILQDACLRNNIDQNQIITWSDVDIPDSQALRCAESIFRYQNIQNGLNYDGAIPEILPS